MGQPGRLLKKNNSGAASRTKSVETGRSRRSTLTDQIADLLKRRILDGELESGDRLWAADLAEELGTSIVPVKEALIILQSEGLVSNVPRRGSIIRQFALKEMEELYDIRELIELKALDLMFAQSEQLPALVKRLAACNAEIGMLREGMEFRDRAAAHGHDRSFHDQLVAASGHGALTHWYSRLNNQVQIIRYASFHIGPRGEKTYVEHEQIIDALARMDQDLAKTAVIAHLDSIRADFRKTISETSQEGEEVSGSARPLPHGRRNKKSGNP